MDRTQALTVIARTLTNLRTLSDHTTRHEQLSLFPTVPPMRFNSIDCAQHNVRDQLVTDLEAVLDYVDGDMPMPLIPEALLPRPLQA